MTPKLSPEQQKTAIDQIIYFFESERDEKIGVIAAENMLNVFLETAGKDIYNKAISDAKQCLKNRMEELHFDLDDLSAF